MKKNTILIILLFGSIFMSCQDSTPEIKITSSVEKLIDTAQGSCPFLAKDSKGNLVLSWIKKTSSGGNVIAYAVASKTASGFEKTIEIPGTENVQPHGENMPKVLFLPSGEIIAAWGAPNPNPKNPYSGKVYYSQSFDNGVTWNKPQSLVSDTSGIDQRYFDLALLPNGQAAIIWLDNRKNTNAEGSALYFATTKGRSGFTDEKLISEPCCPCCRTDLFIDSKKNIHVLYRAIINDSIRDMVHVISSDGGKNFSAPKRISDDNWVINGCPHTGPSITENKNGIQLAWFTGGGGAGIYYCNSRDDGKSFCSREMVSGTGAKHCQITALPNDNTVIVWNENFVNTQLPTSRIGVEVRNPQGENPVKEYITSATGSASFPVIKPVNNKRLLIAYTESIGEKDYVKYKFIEL